MADWSALPRDVLTCVAKRVTSFKDYIAFRAVCEAWRSAATKENFSTSRQVPWLVAFRVPHDPEQTWRFHSLAKNKVHQPLLPFRPHLDSNICSSLGWIMSGDDQNNLCLWHPLSHAQIQLPNQNFNFSTAKFELSSSPSWTSDYTIVVMFNEKCGPGHDWDDPCNLAFLKPGALAWTKVKLSQPAANITHYKGQFYVVDCEGRLMVLDIKDPDRIKLEEVVSIDCLSLQKELDRKYPSTDYDDHGKKNLFYVVESEGVLLLIQQNNLWKKSYCWQPYHEVVKFYVFEVNINNKTLVGLKSLGDKALFFGSGPSFSVRVSSDTAGYCKSDCIYFNMGRFTGIFHMETEEYETYAVEKVHPFITLPWIQRTF